MTLLVSEAMQGPSIVGITDCKSLYDHVTSMSLVAGVQDKRVSADLAIISRA